MEDSWKVRMNICTALWSFVNFYCLIQSEVNTENRKVSTFFAFQHVRCHCCYCSYLDRFLITSLFATNVKLKETENPQDIPVPALVPKIGITSGLLQTFLDPQLGLKDSGEKKQVFSGIERYLKKHITYRNYCIITTFKTHGKLKENAWITKSFGKWVEFKC